MNIPDPMAEIRASFFVECEELLESLQDGLTELDSGQVDEETINVCFRAVHSMKGGAGAFGLEELVRFAHRYETVMDEVRSGRLTPDHEAVLLFMRAADVLSDIVRNLRDGTTCDPAAIEPTLQELEGLVGSDALDDQEEEVIDFQPMALGIPLEIDSGDMGYVIKFKPEPELFRSGNEPRHLLRALADLGSIKTHPDLSNIPQLDALDPEGAYLAWEIELTTNHDLSEIEEVFEFVEGLCSLDIAPRLHDIQPPALPELPGLPPLPGLADLPPLPAQTPTTQTDIHPHLPPGSPADPEFAPQAAPSKMPANKVSSEQKDSPAASTPVASVKKTTVRVDLDRVERLVNLVGELVINQAMLSQSVAQAGLPAISQVSQGLEEFMRLTRDIQDSVMMIRAQPVKSLFQRMARIVRESSAAVEKSVRFVTDGEATEVDKTVIERLADPLTHMIRNAVDHGLERAQARQESGKPPDGCITLSAAHRSGRVVIEVADDGAGIDRLRVRAIAEDRGLISPSQQLSDGEIDELLFLPGFSTSEQVSNLSGRGVGMDVVRRAIQDLGGRVSISSTPGKGTSFTISLPLTLAVLDGMVVNVADETLVVPLSAIAETMAFREDDTRMLGPDTQVMHIRDSFVPLLDLGVELGFRDPCESYQGSVILLILMEDGTRVALIVDAIHEQRQVVIKGLQESYGHVPGIAAATILGDGQVALILDPVDMMANTDGRTRSMTDEMEPAE